MAMLFVAQTVDPTVMQMITNALVHVVEAFLRIVESALNAIEQGLRDALFALHVEGNLQTLIVAIVPLLFLALVLKLMGGFLRLVATVVLLILLVHILEPVVETLMAQG